jgi:hypothetical protein
MTGLNKDDVSKILSELKKSGKITSPKRCFYFSGLFGQVKGLL